MAVTITNTALKKIGEAMSASGLDLQTTFLRMSIKGGGCCGFSYTLEFDSKQELEDKMFEFAFPETADDGLKLKVLVNPASYLYLDGATLDYSTEGMGGFKFTNPKAKSSCGCGQSFSA